MPADAATRASRRQLRRQAAADSGAFQRIGLLASLVLGLGGGAFLLAGYRARPPMQALHAAFPEALLGPGRAEILVRLDEPGTGKPLAGRVRVLIQGQRWRKELGQAEVDGTGVVPFEVPALYGSYTLIVAVDGARAQEELSREIDADRGSRTVLMADSRHVLPGQRVRFLGLGRRLVPLGPAAREPWVLHCSDPQGNLLESRRGMTGDGGAFATEITLPLSARPGLYAVEALVGVLTEEEARAGRRNPRDELLGYLELQVPEGPPTLQVRPLLAGHRFQAGTVMAGAFEVLYLDGTPLPGVAARVVLREQPGHTGRVEGGQEEPDLPPRGAADPAALATAAARAGAEGLHSFVLSLPRLPEGEEGPLPVRLEIRVPQPGGEEELVCPVRLLLHRQPLQIQLEAPARWVAGLPHRVRLALRDLTERPVAARVEVTAPKSGVGLAQGHYEGRGALVLDLTPPPGEEQLLFQVRGEGGELLASQTLALVQPQDRRLDFCLSLEKSLVPPGEPLRLEVRSLRGEDRLWVDLLSEGMVTALLPLEVRGGQGRLEVPFGRLPSGLFQVRAWRWDEGGAPGYEVSCLTLGREVEAVELSRLLEPAEGGTSDRPESLLFEDRQGQLDPFRLPAPFQSLLLLPGTFGMVQADLLLLAQALRDGGPLPPVREELPPFLQDTWTEKGPRQLAKAHLRLQVGGLLLGMAGLMLVLVLALPWVGRVTRKFSGPALLAGLALAGPAAAQRGKPEAAEREVAPRPPRAESWGLLDSAEPGLPGSARAGAHHRSAAGQLAQDGRILLGWEQAGGGPAPSVRLPWRGLVLPQEELELPIWLLLPDPPAGGVIRLALGNGTPGPEVMAAPANRWQPVALRLVGAPPSPALKVLDGRGGVLVEEVLPLALAATPLDRRSWSAPLGEDLEVVLERPSGAPVPEEMFELVVLPRTFDLAGAWLEAPGEWCSLDEVIGRGRVALALAAAMGPGPADEGLEKLGELGQEVLERALAEMLGFEKARAGFGLFPETAAETAQTAAALEFLVLAGFREEQAPAWGRQLVDRTQRWLTLKVGRDGSVYPDAGFPVRILWPGDGRFYLSALAAAALAAHRGQSFFFDDLEGFLLVGLRKERTGLERLAAAEALLAWRRDHPQGLEILQSLAAQIGGDPGLARAGMALWNGAQGDRADLWWAARLARALARAGIAPETGEALRRHLLRRLDPECGWGDAWTTAACLEALLEGEEPSPEPIQVQAAGEAAPVWSAKTRLPLRVDLGSRLLGAAPRLKIATTGGARSRGAVLARHCLPRPAAAGGAPLEVRLEPASPEPGEVGGMIPMTLTLAARGGLPVPMAVVEIQATAGLALLPGSLEAALRRGEVARLLWTPGALRLWYTHVPAEAPRRLDLFFLARGAGGVAVPPVAAWARFSPAAPVRAGGGLYRVNRPAGWGG